MKTKQFLFAILCWVIFGFILSDPLNFIQADPTLIGIWWLITGALFCMGSVFLLMSAFDNY